MDSLRGLQLIQLIRYASFFGIGIVLVKSGLSRTSIGYFESLTFLAGAVSFFWITGIIQAMLPLFGTTSHRNPSQGVEKSPVFFNAFLLLTIFSILAGVTMLIGGNWLADLLNADTERDLVGYIAVYILLNAPSSLLEYIYLLEKKTRKLIRYGWVAFGLQFAFVSLAALLDLNFSLVLIALIASALLRYVWLLVEMKNYTSFRISFSFIRENLSLGVPIMISVLLSGSAQYIDGVIIFANFDQAVFAVFRYGARELPLVALLAYALSNAIIPEMLSLGPVEGLRKLRKRSAALANWLFPVSIAIMLISHLVFPLIYNTEFSESAGVFNIYLLIIVSRLVFPQSILIAYKKTGFLMKASALELILNVMLSLFFVQFWGIRGVAYATVLAYLFERILLIVYVKVLMGISPGQYINIKKHILWSLITILVFIFTELFFGKFLIQEFL